MSRAELFDLGGRVALVTGGSSGIGNATAKALADAGAGSAYAARRSAGIANPLPG